jgi:Na+-transporting NADH:ubiquinone oxidoreductase subunit D
MCAGLVYAQALSCVTASLLRRVTPHRLRILSSTLIIAAYVIVLHNALMAYLPEISSQLGPYVGLIITNCIVLGRVEAFAMQNPPWPSFVDAVFSALGYSCVLLVIAIAREALGFGTVAGFPLPFEFTRLTIMATAPGAFFMLAGVVWAVRWFEGHAAPDTAAEKK